MKNKSNVSVKEKDNSKWWGLGCVVAIVVFIGLPIVFVIIAQSEHQEEMVIEQKKSIMAFWLLLKIAIASILIVLSIILILGVFKKWHKLRVFITYFHGLEENIQKLSSELNASGLNCSYIPFNPEADHDQTIVDITREIRHADVVLSIPGPNSSFVDSEILSVTALQKPLIIILAKDMDRKLNTAFEGYPRFLLSQLEIYNYKPLARFINYVGNQKSIIWDEIAEGIAWYTSVWAGGFLFLIGFHFLLGAAEYVVTFFDVVLSIKIKRLEVYSTILLAVLAALGALFGFILGIYSRIHARKICRQTILTGKTTYRLLKESINSSALEEEVFLSLYNPGLEESE